MEVLKKNFFWIACFLLTAAMVGTWFYATGQLKAATDSRISKINSAKSTINAVNSVEAEDGSRAHPNQSTQDGMNEKLAVLSQSVVDAWKLRYDAQKEILKWPERRLTEQFISVFSKYSPPEILPEDEIGQSERMRRLLQLYAQQIPGEMERICEIIQTNWQFQERLSRAVNPDEQSSTDSEESDEDGDSSQDESDSDSGPSYRQVVKWNEINQELWLQKLTTFKGRDDNQFENNLPTPSQVLMLQQDLWLLEAMFDIIRMVNAQMEDDKPMMGDDGKPVMVQANDLAPVKQIDHVVFGREALALLGEIKDTISNPVGGQGNEGLGSGGRRGSGRGNTKSKASDLALSYLGSPAFHGRYVDAELKPIEAETVRKVVTEETIPGENLELLVAKRVPVRLAVRMDEREIPRFLAACSNSPFAFEVWQVRINKHSSDEVIKLRGKEGSTESGRGGGRGGEGGLGDFGRGGGGGSSGQSFGGGGGNRRKPGQATPALRKDFDVGVEFYGIVKIYNPVNEELLLGKKDDQVAGP